MVVHGVVVAAPFNSFSAIRGVVQPEMLTALVNRRSALSAIVAESAGTPVVPTINPSFISQ